MTLNTALSFLLFIVLHAPTQNMSTGIFVTTEMPKKKANCPKVFFTHDKKTKVCTAVQPIIAEDAFINVTPIRDDVSSKVRHFRLVLSQAGASKLKNIATKLETMELVLIVDEIIVGFIKNKNQIINNSIQIDGPLYSSEVERVHKRLDSIIHANQ